MSVELSLSEATNAKGIAYEILWGVTNNDPSPTLPGPTAQFIPSLSPKDKDSPKKTLSRSPSISNFIPLKTVLDFPSKNILENLLGSAEKTYELYHYIIKNQEGWKKQTQETGKNLYVSYSENKEPSPIRPVQYNCDDSIFIHFTKKHPKDPVLGDGSYKIVILAIDFKTGKKYASLSILKKEDDGEAEKLKIFKGVEGFLQLHYEVSYKNSKGEEKIRLITDLAEDKDLSKCIHRIKTRDLQSVVKQVVKAVAYMHRNKYLHRDLKTQNILISGIASGDIKVLLADMASVCKTSDKEAKKIHRTTSWYASPEYAKALKKSNYQQRNNKNLVNVTTTKHDIWSLGVVIHWIYVRSIPWAKSSNEQPSIEYLLGMPRDWFPEPAVKNTIHHLRWEMLRVNPKERPSMEEIEAKITNTIFPEND